MNLIKYLFFTYIFCIFSATNITDAQQTIFNVPSADVAATKELVLEPIYLTANPTRGNEYITNTNYTALGVGANTELDFTFFNMLSAPQSSSINPALGFKTAIPLLQKEFPVEEFKLIFGNMASISLNGQGLGDWAYLEGSFRIPKVKTRITSGVNFGTRQIFGRNAVFAVIGIEQPIPFTKDKLALVADWMSGTHNFGYSTFGVGLNPTDTLNITVGYTVANHVSCGKNGIVLFIMKKFRF